LKLSPGRFLGVPVKTRLASGFVFTEYFYPEGAVLRRHCHELAYFSLVLSGSYDEHCSQKQVRHCDSENVLYHPAGETHSDAFGKRGGAIFSMELEPRWTSSGSVGTFLTFTGSFSSCSLLSMASMVLVQVCAIFNW
jgi:hypothetical protein